MRYDYEKLFAKIIEAVEGRKSVTQRMQVVIDECSRQKPHPDWALFEQIDFESDAAAIHDWLSVAFDNQQDATAMHGLWFGLVNTSDGIITTSDMYVGCSPDFDEQDIDWASELHTITDSNYLNSKVLHELYARAYRDGEGALGNDAEYPLALAYGAMAAIQSLQGAGQLAAGLSSIQGAAAGYDSGDFLFIGTVINGRYNRCVKAG